MLAFLNMAGGVECMALAKNAGLDLETFFDAIRASAGNSFAWETVMPVMFNGDYDPGFTMELACKDMWLAYNLGRDLQVPLPLHGMVEQMMQMARLRYGNSSGKDFRILLIPQGLKFSCTGLSLISRFIERIRIEHKHLICS